MLETRPDLPVWVDLCLRKATAPSPTERYQVLSEFMHDLRVPNQQMLSQQDQAPLLERNPLLFWKLLSGLLFLLLIVVSV